MYLKISESQVMQLFITFGNLTLDPNSQDFCCTVNFLIKINLQQPYFVNYQKLIFGLSLCSEDHTIVFEQWKLHRNAAVTPGATSATASHSTGFIQVLYI